jgi:hypothetical protein
MRHAELMRCAKSDIRIAAISYWITSSARDSSVGLRRLIAQSPPTFGETRITQAGPDGEDSPALHMEKESGR